MYALAGELAEAEARVYAEARTVVERLHGSRGRGLILTLIAGILPMTRGDYAASKKAAIRAIEEFRAQPDTLVWSLGTLPPVALGGGARNARRCTAVDEAEAATAGGPERQYGVHVGAAVRSVDAAILIGAGRRVAHHYTRLRERDNSTMPS